MQVVDFPIIKVFDTKHKDSAAYCSFIENRQKNRDKNLNEIQLVDEMVSFLEKIELDLFPITTLSFPTFCCLNIRLESPVYAGYSITINFENGIAKYNKATINPETVRALCGDCQKVSELVSAIEELNQKTILLGNLLEDAHIKMKQEKA